MTLSGTQIFDTPFTDAIEESFERCGIEGGPRSGYSMRSARRSINLLFADWANRGYNLWLLEERTQALTEADGSYVLGTDIVDVVEQMVRLVGSSPTQQYNMTRVSLPTHATRSSPTVQGRPTEVWYDRGQASVTANIWPLPDATGEYLLVYWVMRRMDDAGAYTNTADVPFRFLPPFISGLAYYIAEKNPDKCPPDMIMRLEQRYEMDWARAAEEDRERATLSLTPRSSSYRIN